MHFVYVLLPILLIAVVLASVWLERWSVPVILVALGAGILSGSDFLGLLDFDDMILTNRVANLALIFILFHGGFLTKWTDFRPVAFPAGGLATWGVLITALTLFSCLYWGFGWTYEKAVLLSVIISSTDAAAIFSILRRQSLPSRVSSTVEIESAANDPMAILLTTMAVATFASGDHFGAASMLSFLWSFIMGPVVGYVSARAAAWTFNRLKTHDRGYYYVFFLGVVLLTFGVADLLKASGMLAVFTAGLVLGNSSFVHKRGIQNFSGAISTVSNIGMFVLMGLLVSPSKWADVWLEGTLLFLALTVIARPVAVFLGTVGMKLGLREKIFFSWAGLRGAVPIVLATYPAAAGLGIANEIFNLVFFAVLLSILVQGSTMGAVARFLKLSHPPRPKPLFNIELITMAHSDYDVVEIDLPGPEGIPGPLIRDLKLPKGTIIALVTRRNELVVPTGNTRLKGWDHVSMLVHAPDMQKASDILITPFSEGQELKIFPTT